MPTIKDIAREAGVSHGTVSNVFNKTGKVSTEKIRLVEEAAKRLGYVPNAQAQRLRQGGETVFSLILPSLHKDTYLDLYTTLLAECAALGYELSLHLTNDIESLEEDIVGRLPRTGLAAAVVISCLGPRAAALYAPLKYPVLFLDRNVLEQPAKDRAFLGFDLTQAGRDLGRRLLGHGSSHVAFFSSPSRFSDDHQIYQGMMSALEGSGVTVQRFSSDANLALPSAFNILLAEEKADAIVSTALFRAEAVISASACAHPRPAPYLLSLCSSQLFPNPNYEVYSLDYNLLAVTAADLLRRRLRRREELPASTILPCRGFPFRFDGLVRSAPQTISLLTLQSPSTTALRGLLPLFQELTGISVSVTSLSYDDLYDMIQVLNEHHKHDLIRMDVAWLDTLGPGAYRPLSDLGIDPEKFSRHLVGNKSRYYTHVNEIPCCLPFDPSALILLYRSDLFGDAVLKRAYFERYHKTLEVPKTLEQLEQVAEFFTRSCNPDSPTQFGFTYTGGHTTIAACAFQPFYFACGGPVIRDGVLHLNTPEMVNAIRQYLKMSRYVSDINDLWWSDSVREFAEGDTATAVTFSNHVHLVMNSKHSSVVGRTNAAIMPGGQPLLGGGVLGVSRFSDKLEACRRFIEWYYSPNVASALTSLGGTSPLAQTYREPRALASFPWLAAVRDSIEIGKRGIDRNILPGFSNRHFEFVIGTAVRQVIGGHMTPEEAAEFAGSIY